MVTVYLRMFIGGEYDRAQELEDLVNSCINHNTTEICHVDVDQNLVVISFKMSLFFRKANPFDTEPDFDIERMSASCAEMLRKGCDWETFKK